MRISLPSFCYCISYGWLTVMCALCATVYAQYYGGGGWSNNCLINYCPSFCLPYLPYILQNILATLTFGDLGILSRALQSFTTFPAFLNTLQSQSLPLYNAFNSMNTAYGNSFFPFLQSAFSSPSFQTFSQQLASGGVQPSPILPNNFQPQLAASQLNNMQPQPQQTAQQPQLALPLLLPQPQPQPQGGQLPQTGGGGSQSGGGGGAGGLGLGNLAGGGSGGGFGLGNLLQPVLEETQHVIESTEDDLEDGDGGEEGQGGEQNLAPSAQGQWGIPNFNLQQPGQQQQYTHQQGQQQGSEGGFDFGK